MNVKTVSKGARKAQVIVHKQTRHLLHKSGQWTDAAGNEYKQDDKGQFSMVEKS